jgi:hypothetical protein
MRVVYDQAALKMLDHKQAMQVNDLRAGQVRAVVL